MLSKEVKELLLRNAKLHIFMLVNDSYDHTITDSMEYPALSYEGVFDTEGNYHYSSDLMIAELKTGLDDVLLKVYDCSDKRYYTVSLDTLGYEDVMAILKFLL